MTGPEGQPLVVVIHGPSGVGKDSIIAKLRKRANIHRATSSTSRPRRPNEQDGVDYHFLSREQFEAKIACGDFIEHAEVYGDWKGLERRELTGPLAEGVDVLIRTDLQGARQWREKLEGAVYILLAPESPEELRERLEGRHTESPESLARRLAEVDDELADAENNDYVVTNRDGALDEAVEEIARIIERERHNPERRAVRLLS